MITMRSVFVYLWSPMRVLAVLLVLCGEAALPRAVVAQSWQDLVVTMGMSGEAYDGNLASATVPLVDSTNSVGAAVAEAGIRGGLLLFSSNRTLISTDFDLGLRQFLASGFAVRDFAPRETTGRLRLSMNRRWASVGSLRVLAEGRSRRMDDRPPMPLFLQPGYDRLFGSVQFTTLPIDGVTIDVSIDAEQANYDAPQGVPQIDLLDRDSRGLGVGLTWGQGYNIRFHGAYRAVDFSKQASFLGSEPFREDRMLTVGAAWRWQGDVLAELGVDAIVNRSNSRRPEYDAVSFRARLGAPLPVWDLGVNLYAVVTGKSYVDETPFARLVPGEEADNASVVYLDINRPVSSQLDAALRFGFTRAETDIGNSYFRRYGLSVLMSYRPSLP